MRHGRPIINKVSSVYHHHLGLSPAISCSPTAWFTFLVCGKTQRSSPSDPELQRPEILQATPSRTLKGRADYGARVHTTVSLGLRPRLILTRCTKNNDTFVVRGRSSKDARRTPFFPLFPRKMMYAGSLAVRGFVSPCLSSVEHTLGHPNDSLLRQLLARSPYTSALLMYIAFSP